MTDDAADPVSHQPGPKYCAVALARVAVETLIAEDAGTSFLQTPDPEIDMSQIEALTGLIGVAPAAAPAPTEAERTYLGGFLTGLQVAERQPGRGVPVLPPNAPLQPATRLWLDGVLAGLFSRDAAAGGAAGVDVGKGARRSRP